eukprot:9491550-Pyramimonas_sp.AAC.1
MKSTPPLATATAHATNPDRAQQMSLLRRQRSEPDAKNRVCSPSKRRSAPDSICEKGERDGWC